MQGHARRARRHGAAPRRGSTMLARTATLALLPFLGSVAGAAEFTANHLFVADAGSQRIHEFDPSGVKVREIGAGIGLVAGGIAFGPNGHLYAGDFDSDRVVEFDATGAVVKQFGSSSPL